jgi:hypothetical protein
VGNKPVSPPPPAYSPQSLPALPHPPSLPKPVPVPQ